LRSTRLCVRLIKKPFYITADDVRVKKLARKLGSLVVFVVDASGSMAINRMAAATGTAMSLLATAYKVLFFTFF